MNEHQPDDGKVVQLHKHAQPGELAVRDDDEVEEADYLEGRIVEPDDEDYLPHPVIEHGGYIAAGAVVLARRVWESRSTVVYDRTIRAAETMGDLEKVVELLREKRDFQSDRHARRFDWIELPARVIRWLPWVALAILGGLLLLGVLLAIATKDPGQIIEPILWVAALVHLLVVAVSLLWLPALLFGVAASGWALWLLGLRSAEAGEIPWLAHRYQADHEGDPITPSIVVTALRDLGISSLRKSIEAMGDAGAAMLSPIVIAGCGVELEATLPIGTSTLDVQKRHRKLAENLGRHEHEVFITIAKKARTLKFFIADSGALDEPIGPSPLATDTNVRADYYTGRAPWGETLRGQAATVNLLQQHLLITGKSNQGKTASLRALLLWLAFDPTVEFQIADLKGVGDWRMFVGLATELIQGPTDDDCIAATHMVEDAVEEMNRRLTALKESGSEEGVTRDMARTSGSGFHPLVVVVDEAQKAFMCPAEGPDKRPYGGNAKDSRFFNGTRAIQNQGRAVNVTIHLGTQDPTDRNLPAMVRDPAHLRIALYLATESQAKMALGDAPVEQGAAPHKLRDGQDRGTVICHGPGIEVPRGEPAVTIRTHYIDGKQATEIAERARKRRAKVLTSSGRAKELVQPRDLLDDLDEILADKTDKVRVTILPKLLWDRFEYDPYQELTGEELGMKLTAAGIRTTRPQNVLTLDPKDFRDGLLRAATGHREDR